MRKLLIEQRNGCLRNNCDAEPPDRSDPAGAFGMNRVVTPIAAGDDALPVTVNKGMRTALCATMEHERAPMRQRRQPCQTCAIRSMQNRRDHLL